MRRVLTAIVISGLIFVVSFVDFDVFLFKENAIKIKQNTPNGTPFFSASLISQIAACSPITLQQDIVVDETITRVQHKIRGFRENKCLYSLTFQTPLFYENINCSLTRDKLADYSAFLAQSHYEKKEEVESLLTNLFQKGLCTIERNLNDTTTELRQNLQICKPTLNEIQIFDDTIRREIVDTTEKGCFISYSQHTKKNNSLWQLGKMQPLAFSCSLTKAQLQQYATILERQTLHPNTAENPFSPANLEEEINFFIEVCHRVQSAEK